MEASTCHPGAMGAAGVAVQEEKGGGFETLEGAGKGEVIWGCLEVSCPGSETLLESSCCL